MPIAVLVLRWRGEIGLVTVVQVTARQPECRAITYNKFDVISVWKHPFGGEWIRAIEGPCNLGTACKLPIKFVDSLRVGLVVGRIYRRWVIKHHLQGFGSGQIGQKGLENWARREIIHSDNH